MKKEIKHFSARCFPRAMGIKTPCFTPAFRLLEIFKARDYSICPRHQHREFEIVFVERGPYHYSLNAERATLAAGGILMVKPGDWHEDYYAPALRFFNITFDLGDECSGNSAFPVFADTVKPKYQRFRTKGRGLWSVLARIRLESSISDSISPHLQDALVQELFWLLIRALPREALSPWFFSVSSQQAFATRLTQLFQRNITAKFSLVRMAKDMNMSQSALAHKCRAILQIPPAKAFMKYKMEHARLLMKHSSMSIKEISAHLGFNNPYHFSRLFKRHFKLPPSLVR